MTGQQIRRSRGQPGFEIGLSLLSRTIAQIAGSGMPRPTKTFMFSLFLGRLEPWPAARMADLLVFHDVISYVPSRARQCENYRFKTAPP